MSEDSPNPPLPPSFKLLRHLLLHSHYQLQRRKSFKTLCHFQSLRGLFVLFVYWILTALVTEDKLKSSGMHPLPPLRALPQNTFFTRITARWLGNTEDLSLGGSSRSTDLTVLVKWSLKMFRFSPKKLLTPGDNQDTNTIKLYWGRRTKIIMFLLFGLFLKPDVEYYKPSVLYISFSMKRAVSSDSLQGDKAHLSVLFYCLYI